MNAHPTSRSAKITVLTCVTALLLSGASLLRAAEPAKEAAAAKPAAPAPRLFGGVVADSVHTTATVEKINYETREVTLKGEQGVTKVITAGPEVQRLAEIHQGDLIEIVYAEAVAVLAGDPAGAPAREDNTGVHRTSKETAPGGAVVATTRVLATVVALDPKARTVTLKGPKQTVTINVDASVEQFSKVKVGDSVYLEFTRAIAAAVVKTAPAK